MHIYQKLDDGGVIPRHYTGYAKPRIENGQELLRAATLGDLKKWLKKGENVAPSVTSILDIYAKHALINWKIDRHLDEAWTIARKAVEQQNKVDVGAKLNEDDLLNDWRTEVKRLTEIEMDIAPSMGTDFHKEMENHINADKFNDICDEVCKLITKKTNTKMDLWQPEVNIFSDLGYAGQCDLFIPGETSWVIDYKTKQFKDKWKPKKMAYWDSHLSQLMAYGMELDPSCNFKCVNIFVCLETGEIEWHEWEDEKLKTKAWEYFMCALEAWKIKNL